MAMRGAHGAMLLMVVLGLVQAAQATEYEVGGQAYGWTIPSAQNQFNRWAAQKTYYVGDILKFSYNPEMHNVVQVGSINDYHACTLSNQIGQTYTDGSTFFTLTSAGDHFFICSIPGHCQAGMKLAVRAINRPN